MSMGRGRFMSMERCRVHVDGFMLMGRGRVHVEVEA